MDGSTRYDSTVMYFSAWIACFMCNNTELLTKPASVSSSFTRPTCLFLLFHSQRAGQFLMTDVRRIPISTNRNKRAIEIAPIASVVAYLVSSDSYYHIHACINIFLWRRSIMLLCWRPFFVHFSEPYVAACRMHSPNVLYIYHPTSPAID